MYLIYVILTFCMTPRLLLGEESWSCVLGVNTVLGGRLEVAPLVTFTWVKSIIFTKLATDVDFKCGVLMF